MDGFPRRGLGPALAPAPAREGRGGTLALSHDSSCISSHQLVKASPKEGTHTEPTAASTLSQKRTGKSCPGATAEVMPQ